ncbi:hypothetical protein RUM43_004394 [Polyplax serrata]|uniref:Uncharacterized protein n=1 Tax=Polyplax serrata TaxID=468196 RepID=A0AAN8SBX1_POLSC
MGSRVELLELTCESHVVPANSKFMQASKRYPQPPGASAAAAEPPPPPPPPPTDPTEFARNNRTNTRLDSRVTSQRITTRHGHVYHFYKTR